MSGNKAKNLRAAAMDVEKHIELVQPRTNTSKVTASLAETEKVREKIKVRATARKAMAMQQLGEKPKKQSRLIPAEGGMDMGL
jgi:large subunit ribosomal protein L24e